MTPSSAVHSFVRQPSSCIRAEPKKSTRRVILEREGKDAEKYLEEYADPNSERYQAMLDEICRIQNFTSLRYHRLDDLIKSIGIKPCDICTYCFNGEE